MSESHVRDITKEELKTAKIYYICGFFCLPLVWMLNVLNWWRSRKLDTENGKLMRFYVNSSLIGCIVWAVLFVAWIIVYQTMWTKVPFFQSIQMATTEGMAWQ